MSFTRDVLIPVVTVSAALAALSGPVRAQTERPPVIGPAPQHYVVTRPDLRKCAFPMCGGYFVKAVNQMLTQCADGRWQPDCHAAQLDASALGWTDAQKAAFEREFVQGQALVKGRLSVGPIHGMKGNVLSAAQAWQAQSGNPPYGSFYGVKSTGIVCITTPCPSLAAVKLNVNSRPDYPELDLSPTGATPEAVQAAFEALSTTGILAAGVMRPTQHHGLDGQPRWGMTLRASQFYLPAKP